MPNWEKLATDQDLLAMWAGPDMRKEMSLHEDELLRFSSKNTPEKTAYEQGFIAGLLKAKGFPEKMRDIERYKDPEQALEEHRQSRFAEGVRKFRALRFGGV